MPRTALLAGASGLVGGHCLRRLLADDVYTCVTTLGRRAVPHTHPKLLQRTIEFHRLAELPDFPRAHDVFCCLGTTMKQAGSAEAFYRVDFTYVHELARLAARHGAQQFLLVSAVGANPRSKILYNRVKGEVEAAVSRLPFRGVHIFRPSLLLGERREHRAGERLAIALMPAIVVLLIGPLRKYRPLPADAVAAAMIRVAHAERPGVHVYQGARLSSHGG